MNRPTVGSFQWIVSPGPSGRSTREVRGYEDSRQDALRKAIATAQEECDNEDKHWFVNEVVSVSHLVEIPFLPEARLFTWKVVTLTVASGWAISDSRREDIPGRGQGRVR